MIKNKKVSPNKYVCQIGPGEDVPGGMLTVIDRYMSSRHMEEIKQKHIITASTKYKLSTFLKGLFTYLMMCVCHKVCIAHIHMSERGSCYRTMILICVCRIFDIPVIVHSHGSELETFYHTLSRSKQKLFKFTMDKADRVIVLTPGWVTFWKDIVRGSKIKVLPNFVIVKQKRNKSYFADGRLNILFLGYVGNRKGTYDLIKAVKILKDHKIDLYLRICGNGELDKCKRLVSKLKLSKNVFFYGWIDGDKKEDIFEISDVLVLPSYNESFGIVLLEAFAHQIPVICGDKGFSKEIVTEGKDGYIIESGNIKQIASYLEQLYKNEDIAVMGKEGYKKVCKRYSEKMIIEELKKIYEELR